MTIATMQTVQSMMTLVVCIVCRFRFGYGFSFAWMDVRMTVVADDVCCVGLSERVIGARRSRY